MNVKRPIYVNINRLESFRSIKERGKIVSRCLPRSRPQLNLLQLEMKESEFESASQQISNFLTHPDIEGVYETNVPLIFRIISYLGCCSAVSRLTDMKNSHSTLGFDMNELEFRSTAQQPYL